MKRVRVLVSGRVQGVFFRVECARRARDLGVVGYVRNLPDGRVEAAFEGSEKDVDDMVAWCRQGPEWASVEDVGVEEESPTEEQAFRIL